MFGFIMFAPLGIGPRQDIVQFGNLPPCILNARRRGISWRLPRLVFADPYGARHHQVELPLQARPFDATPYEQVVHRG